MEQKKFPEEIISGRIALHKHRLDLAPTMFKYVARDRERLAKFLPWAPLIREIEDEQTYILSTHEKWEQGKMIDYGLFRLEDNMYMGNVGVHTIDWSNEHCELGYWILGDFEGKGFISESVKALEKVCFELGFNRIEIRCDSSNARSASVPKKNGYNLEGHFREHAKNQNGIFHDTLVFAKIKKDLMG